MDEQELLEHIDKMLREGNEDGLLDALQPHLEAVRAEDLENEEILKSRAAKFKFKFEQVEGQEYLKAKRMKELENDAQTWSYKAAQYYRPQSLKGLQQAIKAAKAQGLKVRAIGSRHSFSEIIAIGKQEEGTWDIVTEFGNSNRPNKKAVKDVAGVYLDLAATVTPPDDDAVLGHPNDPQTQRPLRRLKATGSEYTNKYYNVVNGLKVSMVNGILCPEENKNADFKNMDFNSPNAYYYRSLYNTGGGAIQRYAGAFSTGTHGSGGFWTTYHDTIRSIVLVDSDGEVHRIEPNDGITDPAKHEAYYADKDLQVNLIQDDDKFYSTIVSMGCFGIIYSVIIEVMPAARLYEQGFYSEKRAGIAHTEVEAEWNLITAKKIANEIKESYSEMYEAYDALKNNPTKDFTMNDLKKMQDELNKKLRFDYFYVNPYINKHGRRAYVRKTNTYTNEPSKGKRSHRKLWPTFFAELGLTAKLARAIFNAGTRPKVGLIDQALKTMQDNAETKDEGYIDLTYKVWNQGTGKMATIGVSIEYAIPIDEFPEIFQELLDTLEREGKTGRRFYLDGPIAIRFARASKGYLAPNSKEYYSRSKEGNIDKDNPKTSEIYCYIELITLPSRKRNHREKQLELYKYIQDYFVIKGCRPHWGLNMGYPLNQQMLGEMYPNFKKWLATYKFFNKDGTFDNQFTMNAGLRDIDGDVPIA